MSLSPGSSSASASPSSTTTSRKSYAKRYRSSWEALPECKGWLSKYGEDGSDEKAFCKLCNKVLRPHFGDIKKHAASELHRRKISASSNNRYNGGVGAAKTTPSLIKFRSEWSEDPALSDWLTRSVYGARCKTCNVEIPTNLADLKRHSSSKRHLDRLSQHRAEAAAAAAAEKAEIKPWQMPEIRKRRLELRVAAHAAVNELMSTGTADLCKMLRDHFGVSAFNMSASECKALVQLVLAPHFKAELRQDLNDVPFCLVLDYAKHMSSERNISVVARYVSKTRRTILSTYLGTIGHPGDAAMDWADNILGLMSEWELRGDNLVGLVTDGISDICGDREGLVDCLRASCPAAILLHSAYSSLAMVVNSSVKKCLPAELEFVLRESFNWFAMSLERQHKYAKIVRKLGFDTVSSIDDRTDDDSVEEGDWRMDNNGTFGNCFATQRSKPLEAISSDSTQWLSIADFVGAFARSFNLLKEHFAQVRDGEGCFMARLLAEAFLDDKLQLYLSVLQPILTELSELKKLFKLNNAEAADKVGVFFVSLGSQILKPEIIYEMSVEELVDQELDADSCLLDVESVNFGADFTAALDELSLPSAVMHEVKVKAAEFLREIFSLMQKILTNTLAVMKNAEHFGVPNFLRDRLDRSNLIAPFFSHREEDLKAVEEKYRLMKMLDWKNKDCTKAFWLEIHNFGDATGNFPLRVISQSVLKMLCVPIFDIEVERMFNEIFATRQQCLSRMTPDLVEAILHCKYGLARANQRVFEYKPALDMLQM